MKATEPAHNVLTVEGTGQLEILPGGGKTAIDAGEAVDAVIKVGDGMTLKVTNYSAASEDLLLEMFMTDANINNSGDWQWKLTGCTTSGSLKEDSIIVTIAPDAPCLIERVRV